jgi:hypothetical protein
VNITKANYFINIREKLAFTFWSFCKFLRRDNSNNTIAPQTKPPGVEF